MKTINFKTFKYIYFTICFCATIGLSVYSIYRFVINEDTTLVKVTKFLSSKEALYPSFSFCILHPFLENKFGDYGDEKFNISSYRNFLDGSHWNDDMLKIDYDKVTVSLYDNLIGAEYNTHSRNSVDWNVKHFVSFRSSERKCFTIKAPSLEKDLIFWSSVKIKNRIFPSGMRTSSNEMYTYLHYPGQRFTAYYTIKTDFESRKNKTTNFRMEFRVRNIDVITRRNKIHEPCMNNLQYYDYYFMEYWMHKVGCHPPHWRFRKDKSLPVCSNTSQMKEFAEQPHTNDLESFDPPCKHIDQLDYIYHEVDLNDNR